MTSPRDPFSTPDPDRPAGGDTSGQPWGQPGTGSSPTQPPEYGSPQYGEQTSGQPQYETPPYGSQPGQPSYGQQQPGQEPGQQYGQQYGQQPYGQAPYGQQPYGTGAGHGTRNGFGIAALVLGILALLTGLFVIGGLLGIAAIVLGVMGRGRAKRGEANNGGMALAGIILGVLGLLLSILVVVGAASLFSSEEFTNLADCLEEAGSDAAAQQECQRDFEEGVFNSP